MPPLPKRKRSKSRQGTNNAHRQVLEMPHLVQCQHTPARCNGVPRNIVCPQCGYYKGRDVLGLEASELA